MYYVTLTNCFFGPAVLILLLCDIYLSLALFRAVIGQIPSIAHSRFGLGVRRLIDAFPNAVGSILKLPVDSPIWLPWLVTIVTTLLIRNLIFSYFIKLLENY